MSLIGFFGYTSISSVHRISRLFAVKGQACETGTEIVGESVWVLAEYNAICVGPIEPNFSEI
jgi:hypothetical protein